MEREDKKRNGLWSFIKVRLLFIIFINININTVNGSQFTSIEETGISFKKLDKFLNSSRL